MHNPLLLFTQAQLQAFIKTEKTHFVRQTYKRGLDPTDSTKKAAFLLTHYENAEKAQVHYDAIVADPNRFLYVVSNSDHLTKLKIAASQPAGFLVYAALLQEKWIPPEQIASKLKKYIDYRLNWKPGRNDTVTVGLLLQFGTLFIALKYRESEVKVPLSDIENL